MNKTFQIGLLSSLVASALLGGCGKAETAVPVSAQEQAAAQAKAAQAAQAGVSSGLASKQAQDAEAARRAATQAQAPSSQ